MDFSDRAATWDDDPEKLRNAAQVAEAVRRNLDLTGTEDVLEFGGGTGLLSRALADDVGSMSSGACWRCTTCPISTPRWPDCTGC